MQIKQFEDKNLAHYSYALLSDCEKKIVLIDPARNPQPYLDFAKENHAVITGIIETHPHADFVSSHLELSHITVQRYTRAAFLRQPILILPLMKAIPYSLVN